MARDTSDLPHGTLELLGLNALAILRAETATPKRDVSANSNVLESA